MSTGNQSFTNLPGNRETFLVQLPKRMAAIEENWAELRGSEWHSDLLDKLYQRVREISESASRFNLHQLSESSFSLEVYLSSFVGSEKSPEDAAKSEIDGLLRNLEAATAVTANAATPETSGSPRPIYLLGERSGDMETLADTLKRNAAPIHHMTEVDDLLDAIDEQLPCAVVADTTMLPKLSKLSEKLLRLKQQAELELPLIFISASKNLQLRVDAIRAGSSAYYVSPIDAEELAQRIVACGQQHTEQPYRVMVVEDDPTQAEFAASILRKSNVEVISITDPMQVLDELRISVPDLILMDIYMPQVNGIELTTIIREHDEFVGIPIVFLSGEQNADRQIDALSVGGDDFLAKPIRPKQLLAVVKNRIRRSRGLLKAIGKRAPHDKVTGLLSKHQFEQQIDRVLAADPAQLQPSAMLVVAPDDLEGLRESLGMGGLDHLIAALGHSLRERLDETDTASRLDDHMLGILVRRFDVRQIEALCEDLHQHIKAQRFDAADHSIAISVGVGVCLVDTNPGDPAGLITRAQAALSEAQRQGKQQTHICHYAETPQDGGEIDPQLLIGDALRSCLADGSFSIAFQPLLDLESRGSENYEMILRVPTQIGDLLLERDYRQAATKMGLSGDIDRWLLEHAIDTLQRQRTSGAQTRLFVRQSSASVTDQKLPTWLLGRLRALGTVGTGLVLDFLISDLSSDIRGAQKVIAALREFDVEVCLSNFPEKDAAFKVLRFVGANYISVAPRLLKAERDTISRVIDLTHKAGARVIVPNIDDPRAIDLHWSSGADYLQGNFIQRPLDSMEFDFSQVVI